MCDIRKSQELNIKNDAIENAYLFISLKIQVNDKSTRLHVKPLNPGVAILDKSESIAITLAEGTELLVCT